MEFQCRYSQDSYDGYTCNVIKFVKNSSASNGIVFTGTHLLHKTNRDVEWFKIENLAFDVFLRNLSEKFPNLTYLSIKGCGLKEISKMDLIGLDNLKWLDLDENELTYLPDDLFGDMRELRWIDFKSNKLERLSSKLLKPIETSLQGADFRDNTKIDDCFAKSDTKKNLKRLMEIMDSLEPPLQETDPQSEPMRKTDRQYEHHKLMIAQFAEFKASSQFADFTIKIRGKDFKVHKAVLAAESPVFKQTFTNDDGATEKTFSKVKSFSDDSFGHFLNFLYSGKLDNEVNTLEVFELATVFEVAILKEICVDNISATLTEANALEVFNLAHHHDSDQLRAKAFKVIQKMLPDVPDKMVKNPEQVNKLVRIKREYEAIIKGTNEE